MSEPIHADYIIVGAGSAGCVLANRLSADGTKRVLLLEAGGDDRPFHQVHQFASNLMIHIPVGYAKTLKDPAVNWLYTTEPDPGSAGRKHVWPRGKVLGGSSSINAMLYVRGQRADYDGWRQLGCDGWSWSDVLPYFRRAENQERGEDEWHGVGGPLNVADPRDGNPVSDAVIAASAEAGIATSSDINGTAEEGACWFQLTQRGGRRLSTATAYLHPVRHRPNLRIETCAMATRIMVEEGRATGVRFNHGKEVRTAFAAAEVILAGGTINSPQLLQLSGIGPGALLAEHGIAVARDLPAVGENLQDHFMAGLRYRLKPGVPSVNEQSRGWRLGREVLRYLLFRRGLLTLSAAHVGIFCKSRPELDGPDLQFHVLPASIDVERLITEQRLELEREPGLSIVPNQMRPESRGSVHINSSDATVYPTIRANYLAAPRDQQVIVDALKVTQTLSRQPSLARLIESPLEPHLVDADHDKLLTYARLTGATAYHQVGTCRMGPAEGAVVDPRLRVFGITGLRVADASIMPRLISTNTNAAAIMIGEKASEMILADGR